MTTNLNLKYSITFSAATKVIDNNAEFSSEDIAQQQLQFNSNSLINSAAKRIEIQLYPTPYLTPSIHRVYDLDLNSLKIGFLRMIYIKSETQFLYSTADSLINLGTAPRELTQCYVIDKGFMPSPTIFTPDIPYAKFIRLINPLEINGGGSGNSEADIPILVSLLIVSTPATPLI